MLTKFSIKNSQFTIAVFLMLGVLGVNSFVNMPRSEDPAISANFFSIVVVYPGANSIDLEKLVVEPLEESISELDDIKSLTSNMRDGVAVVGVEFNPESDGNRKYDEINRQINNIRHSLPSDLHTLEINQWSTSNVNILQYALVSEKASYKQMVDEANKLKKEIDNIPLIKHIEISACPNQEVKIALNLQMMALKRIAIKDVIYAIESNNINIPAGSVNIGNSKFNLITSGNYKSIFDIQNTIVYSEKGMVTYLRDIATISKEYTAQTHIGRYNGKKALFITVSQKAGTNIFNLVEQVNQKLDNYIYTIPASMKLEKAFDQSLNVDACLMHLYEDFGIAILLIILTLLPLGFRASFIVMISIPASLLIGLFFLYLTGNSLNQLSIVGLVISLGLLVDDSIVVTENIVRFMRNGHSKFDAAVKATGQISWAVIGCTATMVMAFVPLILIPGDSGNFIRSLPLAVVFTLIASLLVSFTLTPFLASRFLKTKEYEKDNFFLKFLNKLNDGPYQKLLTICLKNTKLSLFVSGLAILGSLMLLPIVGFSLFPKAEKPQFFINIQTAAGSNIQHTDSVVHYVESIIGAKKEIRNYCTNVGKGNPVVYYNLMQATEKSNFAQLFVQLEKYDPDKTPLFLKELGNQLGGIPGTRIEIEELQNGTPIDAPISITFFGANLDTLKYLANIGESILKNTSGVAFVKNPFKSSVSDLVIRINKDKAGKLGIPIAEIERTIRLAVSGLYIGNIIDEDGKAYNLSVTIKGDKKKSIDDLDKIYISSISGAQIPLRQLANIEFQHSLNSIEHNNRERSISVSASVKSGFLTDKVSKDVLFKLNSIKFPQGYYYKPFGEISSREETFGNMNTAIIITIFIILIILILEFKTIKGSIIVVSSVPLGIIGSILLLFLTGYSFSFTAFVGMISLIGIEVKNSIILVDYINQLRQKGKSLDEAIQRAGKIRFIPIMLTTLTAIGGLLPLALQGSELFSPLALTIIGGLISSTLFTRIMTPVLCKILLK